MERSAEGREMETRIELVCPCWEMCENGSTCNLTGDAAWECMRSDDTQRAALRSAVGGMFTVGGVMGRANAETK